MPDRILIVDDDQDIRFVLSLLLKDEGYNIVEAQDGKEALGRIREQAPDLILLDISMPDLTGFEVCRQLKEIQDKTDIPVIFLTASDQVENKIKAFAVGGADYVTKPFQKRELLARVKTHLRLEHLRQEMAQANKTLCTRQARLDEDVKSAAAIQRALLPAAIPNIAGLQVAWKFLPCETVAGDIFNIFPVGADYIVMYMVDVSGHGVPAAMLTVSVSQMLQPGLGRIFASSSGTDENRDAPGPRRVLELLNRAYPFERFNMYFTAVYAVLGVKTGLFTYSSAGHPAPLLLSSGAGVRELTAGGPIVGLSATSEFEEETLSLLPGDKLLLFSDGVTDRRNSSGEAFGQERLDAAFEGSQEKSAADTISEIGRALETFGGSSDLEDDVSLLGIGYLGGVK